MNDWWLQGGTQTEKHILVLLRFQRCSRYNQTAYHTCYRSYKGQSTERIGAWHEAAPFLNLNYRSAISFASFFHYSFVQTEYCTTKIYPANSWNKSVDHFRMINTLRSPCVIQILTFSKTAQWVLKITKCNLLLTKLFDGVLIPWGYPLCSKGIILLPGYLFSFSLRCCNF
jgi:hypothetical protein